MEYSYCILRKDIHFKKNDKNDYEKVFHVYKYKKDIITKNKIFKGMERRFIITEEEKKISEKNTFLNSHQECHRRSSVIKEIQSL